MYNSRVYSPNLIRRNFSSQQNYEQSPVPMHQYPQFKEISPQANSAICAYMSPVINRSTVPQIPLQAMVNRLKMQGKIEGKDFVIDEARNGNKSLAINNKYGNEEKRVYYDNDDMNRWSAYVENVYNGNKLLRSTSKNAKGKTFAYTNYYYNKDVPQTSFMPEGLAQCKTSDEYIEYLKANNINYKLEYGENDKSYKKITEYNTENKKIRSSSWNTDILQAVTKYDKRGNENQYIAFCDNQTRVTNYPEKRINVGEFSVKDFPQENFSDAGITFKTSPNEYINYLKANNKAYKVFKVNNDVAKLIKIKELDNDGNTKTSTIWDLDTSSNKPVLKDIKHITNRANGDSTRVVFRKDNTYVERFSFD